MKRHQINLSDEQYTKLCKVQAKKSNNISGLPKFGQLIDYMCDKELKKD